MQKVAEYMEKILYMQNSSQNTLGFVWINWWIYYLKTNTIRLAFYDSLVEKPKCQNTVALFRVASTFFHYLHNQKMSKHRLIFSSLYFEDVLGTKN